MFSTKMLILLQDYLYSHNLSNVIKERGEVLNLRTDAKSFADEIALSLTYASGDKSVAMTRLNARLNNIMYEEGGK